MKIQITDYGVSLITESKQPIKVAKAILGSSYGYTPSKTASNIKGSQVYATEVTGPRVINANVVKYQLGIEYEVGPFTFGEIAYMDSKGKCVALAVADSPIAKLVQTSKARGNSIRVDAYLSMVGGNFDMWIESIGSNIDFYVPIVESFDALPPVVESDPNFYIVDALSSNSSATLAYAGNNGLWEFDNYLFSNVREYTVIGTTPTSVTIDITDVDAQARETLASKFYGDKVIEFNSGKLYSICRVLTNVLIQGNSAVLSFKTPLAIVPKAKDTLLFFSRTDLSISDLVLPVATSDTLGAIKLGDGLVGSVDGTTSVDFPVTSVNGQIGDVELDANDISGLAKVATTGKYSDLIGKPASYVLPVATPTRLGGVKPQDADFSLGDDGALTLKKNYVQSVDGITPNAQGAITLPKPKAIEGLITPTQLPETADLNTYTKAGLFYASNGTKFVNGPTIQATQGLTLEVIPIKSIADACVQRYTCNGHIFVRVHFLDWGAWTDISSSGGAGDIPIASYTQLGKTYVKRDKGLEIGTDGGLSVKAGAGITVGSAGISASVTSVNGQTGDVTVSLNVDDIETNLNLLKNIPDGIAGLTDNTEGEWEGARILSRQAALGTFILSGEWNASTNVCADMDDIPEGVKLLENGYIESINTRQRFDASGLVFRCSVAGNTRLGNISSWKVGDILFGISDVGWIRIGGSIPTPTADGQILYSSGGHWIMLDKGAPNTVLGVNESGNIAWLDRINTKQINIE